MRVVRRYGATRPTRDLSHRRYRVRYDLAYDGGGAAWIGYYRTLRGARVAVWWNRNVASWGGIAEILDTQSGEWVDREDV